jgi:hypothetical protein
MVSPLRDAIVGAIHDRQQRQQQEEFYDVMLRNAVQGGRIAPDEYRAYQEARGPKKMGLGLGLTSGIAEDWKRRMGQSEIDYRKAHEDYFRRSGTPDPNELTPKPLVAADGTVVPGWVLPKTGALIGVQGSRRAGEAGPPPPGVAVPPGFVWNGHRFVKGQEDDITQLEKLSRLSKLEEIDQQIAATAGEMTSGNRRPGPDFLWFGTPFEDQVSQLRSKRDAIARGGELPPATSSGPRPSPNDSPSSTAAGMGGYMPGRRYSGKTYLGGDPNDSNNWQ